MPVRTYWHTCPVDGSSGRLFHKECSKCGEPGEPYGWR